MSNVQRNIPILATLCELLVEQQYGQLAARVFSVLARNGRQTLTNLNKASYLNRRQLRYGLVVLLQHHLIFHSHMLRAGATYYEIDWQQAYAPVRYGKVIKVVEERFGKKSSNVISNLVTIGNARIADLRNAYFPPEDKKKDHESDVDHTNGLSEAKCRVNGSMTSGIASLDNGPSNGIEEEEEVDDAKPRLVNGRVHENGVVNGDTSSSNISNASDHDKESREESPARMDDEAIASISELDTIIYHLMAHGWIIKAEALQYLSPDDLHSVAQHDMAVQDNKGHNPTTKKAKERLADATLKHKRAIRDGWSTMPETQALKRKAADDDSSRPGKRVKLDSGAEWRAPSTWLAPSTNLSELVNLDGNLVVRLNPEKIAVALRTNKLVGLVEERQGFVPAKIYETMLLILEKNIARCFEEWPDPVPDVESEEDDHEMDSKFLVTARDVARKIDPTIDLLDGLDPHAILALTESHANHSVDRHDRIQPPIDPFTLSLDVRTKIITKYINHIADHPHHFVTWVARLGGSQWHVGFRDVSTAAIQTEIENTIAASSDSDDTFPVKLICVLKAKGKVDERMVSNEMMMPAADTRRVVDALTVRGFIQTQEIPRVDRREAKHSIHLIGYSCQRAREKLLHETYIGMVRILQRLEHEKAKVKGLLSKAGRSDVVGNEHKWLSADELAALKRWKEIESKLLQQLWREDDVVAVMRDFIGPLAVA